jgi:hypothetical protein
MVLSPIRNSSEGDIVPILFQSSVILFFCIRVLFTENNCEMGRELGDDQPLIEYRHASTVHVVT